jgi:hypothetical protein
MAAPPCAFNDFKDSGMHERKAHMSLYIVLATFGMVVGMSAICNSVSAETQQSYSELERAVLDGKDIHITIDLAQCVVHDTTKAGPPVRGDIRFDAYMIVGNTIAFSLTHFTVRADNTPVNEFLSYRALSSGKVNVRSKFLNASTNAVIHEAEFDCNLGQGVTFHSR